MQKHNAMRHALHRGAGRSYVIRPIGYIHSPLSELDQAPLQGTEGAPDAVLILRPRFLQAASGIAPGTELLVITWLHLANRGILEVHPRGLASNPLTGVFSTRSPSRPNPIGLHRVTVRSAQGKEIVIGPIEAIDGTLVVDLKVPVDDCSSSTALRQSDSSAGNSSVLGI